jgi:hypothetical protein
MIHPPSDVPMSDYEQWFTNFKEVLQNKQRNKLMWSISDSVRASFMQSADDD